MQCNIRPFAERDWEAVAAIARDAYKVAVTADSLREEDAHRDPKCLQLCWMAEVNGRPVAYSRCVQYSGAYHPRKFEWEAAVLSAYRNRGIGSALLGHMLEAMTAYDPLQFTAGAKEHWPESVAFLEHRGFVETMRNFESTLPLPAFDPVRFAGAVRSAEAQGYTFRSYTELAGAPDLDQRLYALVAELRQDVPSPDAHTEIPQEIWIESRLHRPQFLPDLFLVAFKDGEMVGVSNIWAGEQGAGVLDTGLTAVKRAHRSHGVSKALKVLTLAAAKARGYRLVQTWNEVHNERMLAVNQWLGFERKPGWISYALRLKDQ
jgi:GNAT superfamily N-acetyltransferase